MAKLIANEERGILERLDGALHSPGVSAALDEIATRVTHKLHQDAAALLAWEPVPLALYRDQLPAGIRSSWVFVLRAGTTSGAERHPNSIQRMMSWRGDGDMQTWDGSRWQSNLLIAEAAVPKSLTSAPTKSVEAGRELHLRWVSIPVNVWHKPVMGAEDWVVVSFHTAPDTELIEERGDPATGAPTERHTYSEMASEGNRGSR